MQLPSSPFQSVGTSFSLPAGSCQVTIATSNSRVPQQWLSKLRYEGREGVLAWSVDPELSPPNARGEEEKQKWMHGWFKEQAEVFESRRSHGRR